MRAADLSSTVKPALTHLSPLMLLEELLKKIARYLNCAACNLPIDLLWLSPHIYNPTPCTEQQRVLPCTVRNVKDVYNCDCLTNPKLLKRSFNSKQWPFGVQEFC